VLHQKSESPQSADDPEDVTRDVAKDLRDRLKRDSKSRPYVDAFLLSHADWDHCRGITKHFYLGPPEEYPDDKKKDSEKRIFIREIWSSPLVFRRATAGPRRRLGVSSECSGQSADYSSQCQESRGVATIGVRHGCAKPRWPCLSGSRATLLAFQNVSPALPDTTRSTFDRICLSRLHCLWCEST